jgi:hypothetical protein
MPVTVSVGDNPRRDIAGTSVGDAVTINSGFSSGPVIYQVRRRDQVDPLTQRTVTLEIESTAGLEAYPQVISRSTQRVRAILPFRTHFQARARQSGGQWTDWVDFKTRDKRYQSPDAITQLSDTSWQHGVTKTSHTITVTNSAKATVTETAAGATVTNSDFGYVGTTNIAATSAGATVTNSDSYQSPTGPVTINNL